ncbi:Nuclear control of ATPase protein 2 [Blyttiomyces sp. JEL0837]|nr:Nuclear control of ATPase protein 2 [Blyttiomyces sp. JEL0837]
MPTSPYHGKNRHHSNKHDPVEAFIAYATSTIFASSLTTSSEIEPTRHSLIRALLTSLQRLPVSDGSTASDSILTHDAHNLASIRIALGQVHDAMAADSSDLKVLNDIENTLLERTLVLLQSELAARLLTFSATITEADNYWRHVEQSTRSLLLHAVQESPRQVLSFIRAGIEYQPTLKTLTTSISSSFNALVPRIKTFGLQLVGFAPNFTLADHTLLSRIRADVRRRREHLWKGKKVVAASLGVLVVDGQQIAKESTHGHTELLKLMEAIVNKLQELSSDDVLDLEVPLSRAQFLEADKTTASSSHLSLKEQYVKALLLMDILLLENTPKPLLSLRSTDTGIPSRLTRYWLPALAAVGIPLIINKLYMVNADALKRFYKASVDTVTAFAKNWIVEPILGIYNTIRYKERRLAIMGAESLDSDLQSLERMVMAFARDHGVSNIEDLSRISEKVQRGDLKIIMERYEDDLRNPIRNTVRGDLLRTVLIQVQKAKVDLALAMSGVDKLLQANELNFAIMSIVPVVILLYFSGQAARQYIRTWAGLSFRVSCRNLRISLRSVERLLNRADRCDPKTEGLNAVESGLLLCEIHFLQSQLTRIPVAHRQSFAEDIAELSERNLSILQKLRVAQRMSRTYLFLNSVE